MSGTAEQSIPLWMLDSSTFIHTCFIDRVALLLQLRSPLCVAEFVMRWELTQVDHGETRAWADEWIREGRIRIRQLSLDDLDRIVTLKAPQRISLGEIASGVIAERERGGMLCDDRRARQWLARQLAVTKWEDIEDFLLHAAERGFLGEMDLWDCQRILEKNHYQCKGDLRLEHVERLCNRNRQTASP